jgi:hypothetical protein
MVRFGDMLNALLPARKWVTHRAWHATAWCLSLAVCSLVSARGQEDAAPKKDTAPPAKADSGKPAPKAASTTPDAGKATDAPAPGTPTDPSQTRKIAPNEVFRDARAEKLLGMEKLKTVPAKTVGLNDILDLKAQAGGANANIDKDGIRRVVQAMVSRLTDRANVQALIDQGPGAHATQAHAIQEATVALLEPIFAAKSIKNQAFLTVYYRTLKEALEPLLKNHLIPRIQAMIILGECGSADFLPLYFAQIKDPSQTVWVKLWAMEGLVNVIDDGGRLTAQDQIMAAKTVAEFLEKEADLPWPAQLRALEVLSAMRQGYEPNRPQKATMANAAMTALADGAAKLEVRSEAARALGQMPIGTAVSKYNYPLIAHAAGQLVAELGGRIASGYNTNQEKAKYLTALLIGPVYQAFDGVPGARDSGLLHATGGPSAAYIKKVFDLVKPIAQVTIELPSAGQRQIKNRQKELVDHVAALKEFLEKNAPSDRHLVPEGAEFPIALLPDVGLGAPAAPLAKQQRNNP